MLTQQGPQIQESFLHNKPIEAISDYAPITHADPVLKAARANPGRIIRFHPPTLFSGKDNWPLLHYAKRYELDLKLKLTPFHGHLIDLAEGVRSEQTAYPQAAVSGAIS